MNTSMKVIFSLLLVTIYMVSVGLCTSKVQLKRQINKCTQHCIKVKKESPKHCELYCEGGYAQPMSLSIYEDGVSFTDSKTHESMSDAKNLPTMRFDKGFFNTPSAFDELVQWTHVLKQQVAANAENTFQTHDGSQFHLLPMPIPLSGEQLNSPDFMNRLVDVVPDSDLVYKESSPLTFSEAFKQFLLDVKVDGEQAQNSPDNLAHIQHMENVIQQDMNQFLAHGDQCYVAYEQFLAANNLKKISYTFDSFAPTNHLCVAADQHMANHAQHSKELADFLKSINPNDSLFRAIGLQSQLKHDWNYNKDAIVQFAQEHAHLEATGAHMPSRFQIIVNMIRYYFKQEYFGNGVHLEESCLHAHLDFNALGWREIPVTPQEWFEESAIHTFNARGTVSGRNYFGPGGVLQRMITKILIAYKPTLRFVVSKAMKETFTNQAAQRGFKPLEVGPFVYDRVDFNTGMTDTYEMVITANTMDSQVIGFKSKPFDGNLANHVQRLSTHEMAYCRRENACEVSKIHLAEIHRFSANNRHFYTTNFGEGAGWRHEGVQGYCFTYQHEGTVPIYRYYHPATSQRLYTTNWGELGGGHSGWAYEGVMCYAYPHQAEGTTAWHRYSHPQGDRLWTTSYGEVQVADPNAATSPLFRLLIARLLWSYEGVTAYINTQSTVDKAIGCCKCN